MTLDEIKNRGAIGVPGWPDTYVNSYQEVFQLNDHHNAKNPRTKYLDKDGYFRVWLKNKNHRAGCQFVQLHKLINSAFHGPAPKGWVTNHKNGIRADNDPSNLEWMTPLENERHARRVLGKRLLGEKCSQSKLRTAEVIQIRLMNKQFGSSIHELTAKFGVSRMQIRRILSRTNWGHVYE